MLRYTFGKTGGISDSVFIYLEDFLDEEEQRVLIEYFDSMDDFQPCGNYKGEINRHQKWYQEKKKYFCPTWNHRYSRWESFEYTDVIEKIQRKIQAKINVLRLPRVNEKTTFNSCLVNKYEGTNNYICSHRDSLESFGEYPIIVGVSLGATRKIKFKKVIYDSDNPRSIKTDKSEPVRFSFELKSGSIFVMAGSSQKNFAHEIPPEKNGEDSVRYSMTFREYLL